MTRMRRSAVARRLNVSVGTVQRLELLGKLHPTKDEEAHAVYFDPEEVEALVASGYRPKRIRKRKIETVGVRSGKLAAWAFQAFDQGKDLKDVVKELFISPELVRELWREWKTSLTDGERLEAERRAEREAEKQAEEMRAEQRRMEKEMAWERRAKLRREEARLLREAREGGRR